MASTSAALLGLLGTQGDINYYTVQLKLWSDKYDSNLKQLEKQQKYETAWNNEYDKAMDGTRTSELKMNGYVFLGKEQAGSEYQARQWADYKVEQYDEEVLLELEEKDMEYDSMKTMYEALLETLRAEEEGEKQLVSTDAQDTGLLNQ